MAKSPKRQQAVKRMNLSDHTLDISIRRCNYDKFNFSDIEEYVRELTGTREYQYDAIKRIMIYLWGGAYKSIVELADENYKQKPQIPHRFGNKDMFLRHLPLSDRLSGVVHMATGTGKSYVMFAVAYLSLAMGFTRRVLVLGPSSTIIEEGLRDKFKDLMAAITLNDKLPAKYRGKIIHLLNDNDPIEDDAIVIENINAVYTFGSINDTLFNNTEEVLVLGDEIHHAYSHLKFSEDRLVLDADEGSEGKGEARDERLWMRFLRTNRKITRHIGFTGTPYNQDEYFTDIIYNYSIKDAVEHKYIKQINNHVRTETDEGESSLTIDQRFEMILKNHMENREKYAYKDMDGKRRVKPISIFICPTQKNAQERSEEFIRFLTDYEKTHNGAKGSDSEISGKIRKKVICVVSRVSESEYKAELDNIEETNPAKTGGLVEFIFAVNKLSEGWDVDNVFQIVPMEEKVFNSKLLISQVLGRGMRLPRKVPYAHIATNYPILTVTNHDKFADHIKELLDSVTQSDMYLSSMPVPMSDAGRGAHHFPLFNLNYLPNTRLVDADDADGTRSMTNLSLTPFDETLGVKVIRTKDEKHYELSRDLFTVDEIVYDIHSRFKLRTFESLKFDFGGRAFEGRYPDESDIKDIVLSAMKEAGISDRRLSDLNRKQIDIYFNQFLPRGKKKRVFENIQGDLRPKGTWDMDKTSTRLSELDRDAAAFLSEDWDSELNEQNKIILGYLEEQRGGGEGGRQMSLFQPEEYVRTRPDFIRTYVAGANQPPYVVNTSKFKNPQQIVFVSHSPEKEFVFLLIEHSAYIDSWIKSPDKNFYSIDYEYWKAGKDRVRRSFNPDFFIKIDIDDYSSLLEEKNEIKNLDFLKSLQNRNIEAIIRVVEIKSDEDSDEATPAKAEWAASHFQNVNLKLKSLNKSNIDKQYRTDARQYYTFDLLHPGDYTEWFSKLKRGALGNGDQLPDKWQGHADSEYDEILRRINSDWSGDSTVKKIFDKLVHIVLSGHIEKASLPLFLNGQDTLDEIKKIERTILYFAGHGTQLLELGFVFNEKDNQIPLDIKIVRKALEMGCLISPTSGEEISDFESRVDMVFYPTDKLNNLVNRYVKRQ